MMKQYPSSFLKLLKSVKAKRPKTVINHILKYGQITTEELKDIYGYNHPPRAIRDVKEQGIPIKTSRIAGKDGRKIAVYTFGHPSEVRTTQLSGRTSFLSKLKKTLIKKYGSRCNIYLELFPEKDLQVDHRIPFEIASDSDLLQNKDNYMLLCASANRAKSWSCENCPNWRAKDLATCKSCYWAYPESYKHIATKEIRRLDLLWSGGDIADYEFLAREALRKNKEIPEYVKNVLQNHIRNKKNK